MSRFREKGCGYVWIDGSRERMPRVGRTAMHATGKNRENNASLPSEAGNARSKRVSGVKVPVGTVRYYVLSISYISRCMRGFSQALGTRRARYIWTHAYTLVYDTRVCSTTLTNQTDIVSRHESIVPQPFSPLILFFTFVSFIELQYYFSLGITFLRSHRFFYLIESDLPIIFYDTKKNYSWYYAPEHEHISNIGTRK